MSADEQQPRRQFEPPPWEREAFERFERERAERHAQQELEEQLRRVREPEPVPEVAEDTALVMPVQSEEVTEDLTHAEAQGVEHDTATPKTPAIDPQRVNAMLVELRMQEPPAVKTNMGLVNAVIGFLAVTGLVVIVQAVLLFARARTAEASGTMLAATMSFVVLLTGFGFLGGAILLFRKYHR